MDNIIETAIKAGNFTTLVTAIKESTLNNQNLVFNLQQ